jgi:hypothetical protein
VSCGSEDEAGCGFACAVFCVGTACDTTDAEEIGLIICVLTPVFRIDQFAGKFELMNNLSSRGFSEVIFRRYKGNDGVEELTHGPYERIVMNASPLLSGRRILESSPSVSARRRTLQKNAGIVNWGVTAVRIALGV